MERICGEPECSNLARWNKRIDPLKFYRGRFCQKHTGKIKKKCLYCGFDIRLALHKHHLRKGKCVWLCANCHYILHQLFKSQKLKDMTEEEVWGHLKVVYDENEHK